MRKVYKYGKKKENITESQMAKDTGTFDLDRYISIITSGKYLHLHDLLRLCGRAKEYFSNLGNIESVSAPVTVCGDIHGQYYDLAELFEITGKPPDTNLLFLGDYVDRGHHSCEVFTLLLSFKLRYPKRIYMLRGNHESRAITQAYGFYDEMYRKYKTELAWATSTDVFDFLPVSAVIENRVYCLHAGLSPELETLEDIRKLRRVSEIPLKGPLCDLMWSDPSEMVEYYGASSRGAGYLFGVLATKRFLYMNNLTHIVRAHQLINKGVEYKHEDRTITVFSAPNYCYRCGNTAAVMNVSKNGDLKAVTFESRKRVFPNVREYMYPYMTHKEKISGKIDFEEKFVSQKEVKIRKKEKEILV